MHNTVDSAGAWNPIQALIVNKYTKGAYQILNCCSTSQKNPIFYMMYVHGKSASRPPLNIVYSSQYRCQHWGTQRGRPTLSPRQHLIDSSNILMLKYTLDHQASVPRCIKENILKQKAAHFPTLNLTIKQCFLAPHFKKKYICSLTQLF